MNRLHRADWAALALTLCAFALRIWRLDSVPLGWRDDELINALVISQHALDGNWAVYYPDASGHEALYHWAVAGLRALLGETAFAIRGASVMFGTLTIPLTYLVGTRLIGKWRALLAAAALTVSFWSLMYSRTGIRHIAMPFFMLLAFDWFWRGLRQTEWRAGLWRLTLSGLFSGLGLYTYFASRGVPLILAVFVVYLLLFGRKIILPHWRGIVAHFATTLMVAIPLILTLRRQPEGVYRVEELAAPLTAALNGEFALMGQHIWQTVGMFSFTGDPEYLYNIPLRPIFHPIISLLFWVGVALVVWTVLSGLWQQWRAGSASVSAERWPIHQAAFLFLWWLAGIAPAFISVPPASLGHNIAAQSATYLLLAYPIGKWAAERRLIWTVVGLTLVAIAARDLNDYFVRWPQTPQVRFLYRSDLKELANAIESEQLNDVAISSLLAGPWDREALALDAPSSLSARWYNPSRALFLQPVDILHGYPDIGELYAETRLQPQATIGSSYRWSKAQPVSPPSDTVGCFENGLCLDHAVINRDSGTLDLTFRVAAPLDLPNSPLISNPPPPNVDNRPRLAVFAHLLSATGEIVAGDDGLWVDPTTLQVGDVFIQQHQLLPGAGAVRVGLYDPQTGVRWQVGAQEWLVVADASS